MTSNLLAMRLGVVTQAFINMIVQIAKVLDDATILAVLSALSPKETWVNGKNSAAGLAREAKNNSQADPSLALVRAELSRVTAAIKLNNVFNVTARPAEFARIMFNKYEAGMSYGDHVDAPYVDGVRTDLSFTLFISPPGNYQGGALVIENSGGATSIKLPAGAMAVYPSSFVHRVEPVERGVRIAAVGWVRSRVRDDDYRAMLFELERCLADLAATNSDSAVRTRLTNLRNNLLREWGD